MAMLSRVPAPVRRDQDHQAAGSVALITPLAHQGQMMLFAEDRRTSSSGRWCGTAMVRAACQIVNRSRRQRRASMLPTSFSTPELNSAAPEGEPHGLVQQLVDRAALLRQRRPTIDGLRGIGPMALA